MARNLIRRYYDSGKMQIESELDENGVPNGYCREFFESGALRQETKRVGGLLHGECTQWSEAGRLLGSFHFKHGIGEYIEWFDSGVKKLEMEMEAGVQNGFSRVYDTNGNCISSMYYKNGRVARKNLGR